MSNKHSSLHHAQAQADASAVVSPPPFDVSLLPELDASPWSVEEETENANCRIATSTNSLALKARADEDDSASAYVSTEESKRYTGSIDGSKLTSLAGTRKALSGVLAAGRRRRYEASKKGELSELRALSVELSAQLDALVARNDTLTSRLQRPGRVCRVNADWRGVAFRQLQSRIEAERTNRELRAELRHSREVAQQLVCSLQSHLSLIDAKRLSAVLATPHVKEAMRFTDPELCTVTSLASELGAMKIQVDAVLRDCELPPDPHENQVYSSTQVWRWDPHVGGECLELVETRVVPFDFDLAVPAMDKIMFAMLAEECQPAIIELPGSAHAVKFLFSCVDAELQSTQFQCISVGRVVLEDDRAVMCWRSVTQERGRVGLARDQYEESGWGVARRRASASVDGGKGSTGTSFSYCTRYGKRTPPAPSCGSKRDRGLERFGEMMVRSVEEETVAWYQAMESVVMEGLAAERGNHTLQRREGEELCDA